MAEARLTEADRHALIEANVDRVRVIAALVRRRLPWDFRAFDELVSAGNVGLVEAGMRFDPLRCVLFGTFADRLIRGRMLDYLRSIDMLSRKERERGLVMERTRVSIENVRPIRAPDQDHLRIEAKVSVEKLLGGLRTRLAKVLKLRYVEGLSGADVAAQLGVNASRVSQLETEAIDILRAGCRVIRPGRKTRQRRLVAAAAA